MKVLLFLIVLSFSHIISANQKGTNLVELNNMRATVALKRKPDGSFCQLDVRGNSKLTPSFVKSAHRKASAPKSNAPICSESDIKAFQKGAKKLNLKGAKGQKTSVGALLGTLAKSAGVGCVFGAGISWVADMWKGNSNDEKTEARSSCIDCANQSTEEEKEVKDLKATNRLIMGGGAVTGGLVGLKPPSPVDIAREVHRENILNNIVETGVKSDRVQNKLKQLASQISDGELKMNELSKQISELERNNSLIDKSPHEKQLKLYKEQRLEIRGKVADFNSRKDFWTKIYNIHKLNTAPLGTRDLRRILIMSEVMNDQVIQQVDDIPREKLLQDIKTNPEVKERILRTKSPTSHLGKLVSGIVGGVAGAIVCEDGTTYLLSKEKIEDI